MKSKGRAFLASIVLGAAGFGMAQDKAPEPSKPAPAPSRSEGSSTAPKLPRRLAVVGTLVAFDTEKATVTFKDESGKTLTWPVEARLAANARGYAEQRLTTLKEGDRIRIIYVAETGEGPRVYDVRPTLTRPRGADR